MNILLYTKSRPKVFITFSVERSTLLLSLDETPHELHEGKMRVNNCSNPRNSKQTKAQRISWAHEPRNFEALRLIEALGDHYLELLDRLRDEPRVVPRALAGRQHGSVRRLQSPVNSDSRRYQSNARQYRQWWSGNSCGLRARSGRAVERSVDASYTAAVRLANQMKTCSLRNIECTHELWKSIFQTWHELNIACILNNEL